MGAGGLVPLNDLASMFPYAIDTRKLKMATKIGWKYLLEMVQSRHRVKVAAEVRLHSADVIDMGKAIARTLPTVIAITVEDAHAN